MKDYAELAVLIAIGVAIIAGISSVTRGESFSETFIYAVVAVVTVTVSMVATILAFHEFGRRKGSGESVGLMVAAWLTGIFVTTPICLTLAFAFLNNIRGSH